jgi:vitamin B12 transporter
MRTKRREVDPVWVNNRTKYIGETTKFDYQSIFIIHETNTLVAGVDVVKESVDQVTPWYGPIPFDGKKKYKPDVVSTGFYIEDQINLNNVFFVTLGGRNEHHKAFGNHLTWQASAAVVLPTQTKLKASGGSGFKAPTLFQLHIGYPAWGTFANPSLKPEKTLGWDIGFEQSLFDNRVLFGSTLFHNQVKDYLTPDGFNGWNGTYQNMDKYKTWGIESFANIVLTDMLTLTVQHTYLKTEVVKWIDPSQNGNEMPLRPKHAFSINADWRFFEKGTLTAGIRVIGKRWTNLTNTARLPGLAVARLGAAWKFNDSCEIFARVENLFDKKYELQPGYGTEPRTFFGGITFSF